MHTDRVKKACYRFYVGHNYDSQGEAVGKVADILESLQISGATIIQTIGYWERQIEDSLIVEVVDWPEEYELWPSLLVQALKHALKQESVLVTIQQLDITRLS